MPPCPLDVRQNLQQASSRKKTNWPLETDLVSSQSCTMQDDDVTLHDLAELIRRNASILQSVKGTAERLQGVQANQIDRISRLEELTDELVRRIPLIVPSPVDTEDVTAPLVGASNVSPVDQRTIDLINCKMRSGPPALKWVIILTVLSFVDAVPSLKQWIPLEAITSLRPVRNSLKGVSGLALLFFSVPRNDKKDMYRKRDGTIFAFIMRWIFASLISSGRQLVYNKKEDEPQWLSDLGDDKKTRAIVNRRLSIFETKNPVDPESRPAQPRRKKRRTPMRAILDSPKPPADVVRKLLLDVRGNVLEFFTSNRRAMRLAMFRSLLFLVEKIESFENVETARQHGYYFEFDEASIAAEMDISSASPICPAWDVPSSLVIGDDSDVQTVDEKNEALLAGLIKRFPSMTVTLHWAKEVQFSATDERKSHPHYKKENLSWPACLDVQLHLLCRELLVEFIRTNSEAFVLRMSRITFKALHILAIGVRAVLRRSQGLPLTLIENIACGSAVHFERERNVEQVSLAMESETPAKPARSASPSAGATTNASPATPHAASSTSSVPTTPRSAARKSSARNDDRKSIMNRMFYISWEQYLEYLEAEEMERRLQSAALGSISHTTGRDQTASNLSPETATHCETDSALLVLGNQEESDDLDDAFNMF